ncbi:hypothetical protein D3C72_1351750 [compost metagenome]
MGPAGEPERCGRRELPRRAGQPRCGGPVDRRQCGDELSEPAGARRAAGSHAIDPAAARTVARAGAQAVRGGLQLAPGMAAGAIGISCGGRTGAAAAAADLRTGKRAGHPRGRQSRSHRARLAAVRAGGAWRAGRLAIRIAAPAARYRARGTQPGCRQRQPGRYARPAAAFVQADGRRRRASDDPHRFPACAHCPVAPDGAGGRPPVRWRARAGADGCGRRPARPARVHI